MKGGESCEWRPQTRDSFRAYEPATMADSRGERPTGRTGDSATRRAAGLRLPAADGYAAATSPSLGMAACAGDLCPDGHQHRGLPAHGAARRLADRPFGGQLMNHWGANVGVLVLADHQWWRLVTSTFVHSGIIHIATNMWCLYNLGLLGEPLMGAFGIVAAYLLTGVVGNLLSVALHPGVITAGQIMDVGVISVGASGAVFGLAGVLTPLLGSKLLPVNRAEVARLRRSVIYFAVLNFVIGFGADAFNTPIRIDNMAHLGGFLTGLLLGFLLVPKLGSDRQLWIRRQWLAYG